MARANGDNEELKRQLQKRQETSNTDNKPATFADLIKKHHASLAATLPKHMTADRLMRVLMNCVRLNPKLQECEQTSVVAAIYQSAQLGLEPGPLGHAYLIPYNNKKKDANGKEYWVLECQFQIGYKGMLELVRRSGEVQLIYANEVREKDEFELEYGTNGRLYHKPYLGDEDPGKVRCYYAYAKLKDGSERYVVMSMSAMLQHRDKYTKSKYFDKDKQQYVYTGPWATEFDQMALKTVLKRLCKTLPLSVELQTQLAQDETIKRDIEPDMTMVVDLSNSEYEFGGDATEDVSAASETAATTEPETEGGGSGEPAGLNI
jgi:recombination protein RecT